MPLWINRNTGLPLLTSKQGSYCLFTIYFSDYSKNYSWSVYRLVNKRIVTFSWIVAWQSQANLSSSSASEKLLPNLTAEVYFICFIMISFSAVVMSVLLSQVNLGFQCFFLYRLQDSILSWSEMEFKEFEPRFKSAKSL